MKEVKAFVRTYLIEKVLDSLRSIEGLPGVTISTVKGFGSSAAEEAPHEGLDREALYAERAKLEIFVPDRLAGTVVNAIQSAARTGRVGDGHVFVINVEEAVKIRTGERGEEAL